MRWLPPLAALLLAACATAPAPAPATMPTSMPAASQPAYGHARGAWKEQGHGHTGHGGHHKGPLGHRFTDAEKWAKRFEDPARDAWQKPDAVLAALDLQPDMLVADIGAATGYFSVRLAHALPAGQVYGVDIEPSMVRYLEARAKRESFGNLTAVLGTPADPRIPEAVDLVFISNTYHHIPDRVAYFRRLAAKLKPGGRVAVVDFKLVKLPFGGPPMAHRVNPERLHTELTAAGYTRVKVDTTTLPYQYIAIYRRPGG